MVAGGLGQMCTPRERRNPLPRATWAADNGCYGTGYPGDVAWLAWLRKHRPHRARCLFATAPDVVGDAQATLTRSLPWLPVIRALNYPAALVAQDGLEHLPVPWDQFDVLFLGGSTAWKTGAAAADLTAEAVTRGKPVHMGRVNSLRRFRYAADLGCTSADGTHLTYRPTKYLPEVRRWMEAIA